jgi:hypothetical protein
LREKARGGLIISFTLSRAFFVLKFMNQEVRIEFSLEDSHNMQWRIAKIFRRR